MPPWASGPSRWYFPNRRGYLSRLCGEAAMADRNALVGLRDAHLPELGRDLDLITGWPEERLTDVAAYDGPVLWVGTSGGVIRYESS